MTGTPSDQHTAGQGPEKERIETDTRRTLEAARRLAVLADEAGHPPALRFEP